jgi:alkylation response protein AidB-like acyl-CoA dehydrogenase
MNFHPSDERRMLADSLDRYVAEQYGIETRHRISQSAAGYSPEQWSQFADLGIIAALFTEAQGGWGGTGFDIATVFESLGRGLVVEPFLASAVLAGSALSHAGTPPQQALVDEIMAGHLIATLAHEEAHSHDALHRVSTRATLDGDHYVIDGIKAVVPFGDQAAQIIVSARTSGEVADEAGISLFIVPANTPGVSTRGHTNVDGTHAAEVTLQQVRVPVTALLGAPGQGLATLEHAVGRGILALCAESLGAMEVCKTATVEYLQTRQQFGKAIGSFQALQHRMADLLLGIEQTRSAVINAAAALEDPDRVTRERALSAAKYTVGATGARVAEECIQLHGGIGMTWELPMPHYAKRLVMIDHQLGDEDHHLARYSALGLLNDAGA